MEVVAHGQTHTTDRGGKKVVVDHPLDSINVSTLSFPHHCCQIFRFRQGHVRVRIEMLVTIVVP